MLVLLAAALPALSACGTAFFCPREAIRGTLQTPLVGGEDAVNDTLAGNLESRRDENPELTAVAAAIEGRALGGRGVSMWLQRGLDHTLNLSLRLPTPLRAGDVLAVVEAHATRTPFWGTIPNPPAGLSVGVTLDAFVATSASGSARVLGVDPLRLELDVVAAGPGRQVPIDGILTVRYETEADSCFE
jgi:hypothetical protein